MEQILSNEWVKAVMVILYALFVFYMSYFLAGSLMDFAEKNTERARKSLLKSAIIAVGYAILLCAFIPDMTVTVWLITGFLILVGIVSEVMRRCMQER